MALAYLSKADHLGSAFFVPEKSEITEMDTEKYFRASDIYSHPATRTRPARRGYLPIKRSQFYDLLKQGKMPAPDAKIGGTNLWSGSLLRSAVTMLNGETDG